MERLAPSAAIFGLAVLYLYSIQTVANSFKCGPPRSVKENFDDALTVFQGKVIGEEEIDLLKPVGPLKFKRSHVFRFKVENWWKGGNQKEIEIHVLMFEYKGQYSFPPESFVFEKDKRYLVYAFSQYDYKNMLVTSICQRTKNIERAQEDLNFLGKGQEPEQ